MSRAFDEVKEEREQALLDAHVATHLGISEAVLTDHPYEIDEVTLNDGTPIGWRVSWTVDPPPGVNAQGGPVEWWNDIPIGHFKKGAISDAMALSVLAAFMTPERKAELVNSSQNGPVSRLDMLSIGNQMTRFMHHVVGTMMAMDGHNLQSLDKLSQATTVIDDFAAAVLDGAHWRFNFNEDGDDE